LEERNPHNVRKGRKRIKKGVREKKNTKEKTEVNRTQFKVRGGKLLQVGGKKGKIRVRLETKNKWSGGEKVKYRKEKGKLSPKRGKRVSKREKKEGYTCSKKRGQRGGEVLGKAEEYNHKGLLKNRV